MTSKVTLSGGGGCTQRCSVEPAAFHPPKRHRNEFFAFRGVLSRRAQIVTAVAASLIVLALWETLDPARLDQLALLAAAQRHVRDALEHDRPEESADARRHLHAPRLGRVHPFGRHGGADRHAMSSFRGVGAALEPIVDFIRYLPVPALVPL